MGRGRMRRGRDRGGAGLRKERAAAGAVRPVARRAVRRRGQARGQRRLRHGHAPGAEHRCVQARRRPARRRVRVHRDHAAAERPGTGAGHADRDGSGRRRAGRRRAGRPAASNPGGERGRPSRRDDHGARPARSRRLRPQGVARTAAAHAAARLDARRLAVAAGRPGPAAPVLYRRRLQRSRAAGPAEHARGAAADRGARRAATVPRSHTPRRK